MIHRIFRREFVPMPELVRGVRDGDVERARTVGDGVQLMLLGLHVHHSGPVARPCRRAGQPLAAAGAAERDDLAATLDQLRVPLLEHLDEEEEHILPLAEEYIAPEEWDQLAEHGRRGFPKSKLFIQLGSISKTRRRESAPRSSARCPSPWC